MNSAKNALNVYVEQEEDSSSASNSRDTSLEIPERQGLLPPLPDLNDDLHSPVFTDDNNSSLHSRTQSLEKVITPLHRSRASSNKVTTPIVTTPKAELFTTQSEVQTPTSTTKYESGLVTPVRERLLEEGEGVKTLDYSPTITIDERFEVSVEIPSEKSLPKTTEDKIKFFETFQKKEAQEFDKTLSSLKKGGWLSSKDLSSLEKKKHNHFKKWENKIKELKSSLRSKKPYDHGLGSYFSPKPTDVEDFKGDKSPNLQTLEQQFSVLGISRS